MSQPVAEGRKNRRAARRMDKLLRGHIRKTPRHPDSSDLGFGSAWVRPFPGSYELLHHLVQAIAPVPSEQQDPLRRLIHPVLTETEQERGPFVGRWF